MQRAAGPMSRGVPGVVPAVVGPIVAADSDIGQPVTVEVNVLPHIAADVVMVRVGIQAQVDRVLHAGMNEVGVFFVGGHHPQPAVDPTGLDIDNPRA